MLIIAELGCACLVYPAACALINALVLDAKAWIIHQLEKFDTGHKDKEPTVVFKHCSVLARILRRMHTRRTPLKDRISLISGE